MSEHMAEPDSRERNPKVEMIWGLLAPYIASEDPPDLSNDDQAEILTAGALPQVWELVLGLEARLSKMEPALHEIGMRATRHQRGTNDAAYLVRDLQAIEEICEALAGESDE